MTAGADSLRLTATNQVKAGSGEVVMLLMSGGVDSSTSAYLLKQMGYAAAGVTMQTKKSEDGGPGKAVNDAAQVATQLGIPHYWVNVTEAFEEMVVGKFRRAYAGGRTPNPCVDCNINIKFGLLWDIGRKQLNARRIATGHYARVLEAGGDFLLARAADRTKDQSYFLSGIAREKLANIIFPLGEHVKADVRRIATEIGLHVADRTESMELCFAGEGDYRAMLGLQHADNEGPLLDMDGRQIGTHKGIANYTIGQRRGLGFAGGEPLYVGAVDPVKNTVTLGTRAQVCRHIVTAGDVNVLIPEEFTACAKVKGKVRSYGDGRACIIEKAAPDAMSVRFAEEEFAPCPGQRLVIYDDKECVIAGGTIGGNECI